MNRLLFFVSAPAWQVFLLMSLPIILATVVSPIIKSMIAMQIGMLITIWSVLLWIYSVCSFIVEKYSSNLSIPIIRLKVCLSYNFIYSTFFIFGIIPSDYLDFLHMTAFCSNIYVPENSIWSIEGIYDKEIYEVLERYYTDDGRSINKGTIWPRQKYLKVILNKESKEEIKSKITNWDFDIEFTHQHVYYQDNVFLTSYDNLHEGCSWISKSIDSNELENLEALGIIKIEKSTEPIA